MKKEFAWGVLVFVNLILIVGIVSVIFGGEQEITTAAVSEVEERNESLEEITGKFIVEDDDVRFVPNQGTGGF